MAAITEPEVFKRTWLFVYTRPAERWPGLVRKGWPQGNRDDKVITAHELRISVFQRTGEEPQLDSIYVGGAWPNGNPVRMVRVHHDADPEHCLIVHAPGWVMELAADAISRAGGN